MALATSAATDTMFAAAANADTASTANVTFAAGVQDAPIVLAPAITCAVATPLLLQGALAVVSRM